MRTAPVKRLVDPTVVGCDHLSWEVMSGTHGPNGGASHHDETRRERPSGREEPSSRDEPSNRDELSSREAVTRAEPVAARAASSPTRTGDDVPDGDLPRDRFPVADWDRYRFIGFLGMGGMGAVYKAHDPLLQRDVALKFLLHAESERARRFIAEARAQARVEHEHVCKVYEVGTAHGKPYIAMQLIDGVTLARAAAQMSVDDKVHVIRKVAEAVQAAHHEGLIHRDLKTANVMVERTEGGKWQPFVLDFGLAREVDAGQTIAGEVAGTPAFMAPEQARGGRVDKLTDVWGLGATAYALLSGRPPNKGTTAEAFASLVTKEVPPIRRFAPQLPSDLATIVMKCLEPTPERRYASVAALVEDLRRFVAGDPIAARPPSLVYRASKRLRRSWRLAAALAIAIAALVTVAVLVMTAAAERRLTDKRLRIAQRFGQEVARVETFMRQAYAAPLHDIRPERQHVLDRMKALQAEARQLGEVATGPAEYAVGRGYLSLHDHASARTHLEAAMTAEYDVPEVRYALGLTLAALYQEGIANAERIRDAAVRETRRSELRRTLRDPALAHLRAVGDSAPEAQTYVEGLVAFYEGDLAGAVTKAAAAARTAPWMYEARKLAGDALTARAAESDQRGAYDEAAADLERAGAEYTAALAAAPSDATLLGAECARGAKKVSLAQSTRQLDRKLLETALEPCVRARQADPASSAFMVREAFILGEGGEYLAMRRGESPDWVLARGLPLVESALAIAPRSAEVYYARSTLLGAIARIQADKREDPEQNVDLTAAALRRVIELDAAYIDAYADLAFLLYERAKREREAGRDPRRILAEAKQIVERGIAVAPDSSALRSELGVLWNAQADYELERGEDAQPSLDKAIAAFEAALAKNPNDGDASNNLGLALQNRAFDRLQRGHVEGEADLEHAKQAYKKVLSLGVDAKTLSNLGFLAIDHATHLVKTGRDPRAVVEEGADYLRRSIEANPSEPNAYFNAATLWLVDAEYRVDRSIDPTSSLAAIDAAIDADLRRSATPDPSLLAFRSNGRVLAGQWAMAHKQSPDKDFATAESALARAESLDVTPYVVDARARLEKGRLQWAVSRDRDVKSAFTRAKAALSRAKEVFGDRTVRLLVADLALFEARSLDKATSADAKRRRADALATARRELEAALADNPMLEHKIGPRLKELASM